MSGGMHSISSMVIQGLSQLRAASMTLREKAAPVNRQAGEQRLPPGPLSALPRVRTLQHLWHLSRCRSAGGRLHVASRLRPSFMPVTIAPLADTLRLHNQSQTASSMLSDTLTLHVGLQPATGNWAV